MTRRAARVLLAATVCAALLLAALHALTRERIARNGAPHALLAQVLPAALFDNEPGADEVRLRAPAWLGSTAPLRAWRARRDGQPSALVLEAVAPRGYAGPIALLVAVDTQGRVLGVRVTAHRETPGLGDAIDARRSDWIAGFTGRSLSDLPRRRWAVKRDGGDFDQVAGATITPRAVVGEVRRVLEYVAKHGAGIHAAPAGTLLDHDDAPAD